jgi:hypothetical protein
MPSATRRLAVGQFDRDDIDRWRLPDRSRCGLPLRVHPDLDLRPVTDRWSVHLKEIRGTLEAYGSSLRGPTTRLNSKATDNAHLLPCAAQRSP